jgi:choline dehydrogenase-like flavoprotein
MEQKTGSEAPEAIVVGTGFGGAVTACRLAQAGFKVLVLERGRRYEASDFPALPQAPALLPDLSRWTWGSSQGLWDILDLEEIVSVQAAGYGGGSLIYANVHLKPPAEVFKKGWPKDYQQAGFLDSFFNLAGYMLSVAPITTHPTIERNLVKAHQLKRVAEHLGRGHEFFHPPLAISSKTGPNVHGVQQNACTACGKCCSGCPEGAKNTLDYNYLAIAERCGAVVRTQCEVLDVIEGYCGGWTVRVVDHLHGNTEELSAPYLFLCAGSVHTTRLLLRAEQDPEHPTVPAGAAYFPGGDALGMIYDTANPQHPSYGPTITTTTVHVRSQDPSSFFLIQDGGYGAELQRLTGMLRAPAWIGRNRLLRASGKALVPASPVVPPEPAAAPRVPELPSPLDGVLDARSAGTFAKMVSPQLDKAFLPFLAEVQIPLMFPAVVGRTIEESVQQFSDWFWLTRWLPRRVRRALERLGRCFIGWAFGPDHAIAQRAIHAMFTGSGLSPAQMAERTLGYDAAGEDNRVMLLAMGRDAARGTLLYDRERDRLIADLNLFHLAPGYTDQEALMTDIARALGGELRTNPAWAFLGKPITVHNQGGCPMSDAGEGGVTDGNGKVYGKEGLYVVDGSNLCTSVGVNPSATITAIAEHHMSEFIEGHQPLSPNAEGMREYAEHRFKAQRWADHAATAGWVRTPPMPSPPRQTSVGFRSRPLGLRFSETMQGFYEPGVQSPGGDDAEYRKHETRGRPDYPIQFDLTAYVENLAAFYEDDKHRFALEGSITMRLPGDPARQEYDPIAVKGTLELFVPRFKPYGLAPNDARTKVHERLAGRYRTQVGQPPKQRFMGYTLELIGRPGWRVEGYKRIRDDAGLDAWRDTSSLFTTVFGPPATGNVVRGAGVAHVDLPGFLFKQIRSIEIGYVSGAAPKRGFTPAVPEEPAGEAALITWASVKFATFFFGSLQRIYMPELETAIQTAFGVNSSNIRHEVSRRR